MDLQPTKSDEIKQYVQEVVAFSTEYSSDGSWSASCLIGPPSCNNRYGDQASTWCPGRCNQDEFVEVKYQQDVYATKFRIYENLNGGSCVKIEALNNKNTYVTLWSREKPELITKYNIFEPTFNKNTFKSRQYKITLKCTASNYYSEIDAIELIGTLVNSLVVQIPCPSITNDLLCLFQSRIYSDIDVNVNETIFKLHRNILLVRCQMLFNSINENNNKFDELAPDPFAIVLEFLYTDQLNDSKLELLNERLQKETELIGLDGVKHEYPNISINVTFEGSLEKFEEKQEKWKSHINKLIRFSVKYKLLRLENLLLHYLSTKYLTIENVLNVLVDAAKGIPYTIENKSTKLDEIRLSKVELLCMDYIKLNSYEVFNLPIVYYLPREIFIKAIQYAVKP